MRTPRSILILPALVVAAVGYAVAAEVSTDSWRLPAETARLKPAPEAALVTANCVVCHSADYIATQPPLNRQQWTALVTKMRTKFGAPVMTNQVDKIVDYLVANYGRE